MKKCATCQLEKLLNQFGKHKRNPDGLYYTCKDCRKLYNNQYYSTHKEYSKRWYKENQERKKKYQRNYNSVNIKNISKKRTEKKKTDINYRLQHILRSRLYQAIKRNYKAGSAVTDLGCSIEFFKQYLESKFRTNMTWENYGRKGWHIDHIIPLASFDLSIREDFLKACNYTNLQPLWWKENLEKSSKII